MSKDKEVIELIETTQPTFSRRKSEDNFSIEWAYLISIKTNLQMRWILTGGGPKKIGELSSNRKFEILDQAEEWLGEQVRKNPDRKTWFELHLLDSFPAFREWREKREITSNEDVDFKKQANGGGWK